MLWRVNQLERRRVEVDRSSAGLGRAVVTQLLHGDKVLANAVEWTRWRDTAQVIVCTHCGVEGCESGGWVAPRKVGDHVLWLRTLHAPPAYFEKHGIPLIDAAQLPSRALAETLLLRGEDVVRLLQMTAPDSLLGALGSDVVLREPAVIAVSEGERAEALAALKTVLAETLAVREPVAFDPLSDGEVPISFYLDARGHPSWSPMVRVAGVLRVHIEGLGAMRVC